jgi:hypothetical protein
MLTKNYEELQQIISDNTLQLNDDREGGELPPTVDTMSKNTGENRHSDSVNSVNSKKIGDAPCTIALQLF